jgi:glycosyltransferase involved in cell wall biosynthesis
MRYAIVTETYSPEVNGVALTVKSLEDGLRNRGHDVEVIRPKQFAEQAASDDEIIVAGLPLPRYPGLRFGLPVVGRLVDAWRRRRPDAIYVATEGPLGWAALRAARKLNIATASGFHTRFDEYMRDYGIPFLRHTAFRWMRHFHNLADATLVPTDELRIFLQRNGFKNVIRLARAVDNELFNPRRRDPILRAEWGIDDDDLAVIYLGRIAAEKNLGLAIRAFRELQKNCPSARFVWVGDGPEQARIERENPDFVFCGTLRGEVLARHFASADLFLFPSRSETYGNVTLEAMASGVPTIAFDYGAAREWLRDGVNGIPIVETGDSTRDETAFIKAACDIALDAGLLSKMSSAARQSVAALQPQRVAQDFDRILNSLATARFAHACDGPTTKIAR